jgi:adenine phosphoribosyltransferase
MSIDLAALVRNVPDFPKPGVQFKDITTLLLNGGALQQIIDGWVTRYADRDVTAICGADARGFIFAGALAYAMGVAFIPARKPGKLPGEIITEEYELEYGTTSLAMHTDALKKGDRVLVVDDLLATGGTMQACCKLCERLGAEVVEVAFVIELPPLGGRKKLAEYPVHSLIEFMVE